MSPLTPTDENYLRMGVELALIFITHRQLAYVLVSLPLPIEQETPKLGDLARDPGH